MSSFQTPVSSRVLSFTPLAIDPLGRIVRAYDRAIRACEAFDHIEARTAIGVLRASLELDSPASRGFDALYEWCESAIDAHDFIGPARTLRSLREAWCLAGRPAPIAVRSEWPVS